MSKKSKWKSGPPPHVGWWNASLARDKYTWRWWDGLRWSSSASWLSGPNYAAERAALVCLPAYRDHGDIEWRDYWPKNARVPRVKP